MFKPAQQYGANAYSRLDVETNVVDANPHKLISMLFDGARTAVSSALAHMRQGNVRGKCEAISKAMAIIDSGLRASLDTTEGGDLAAQLDALYEYMTHRLLLANMKNQPEILEEVSHLLAELHEGWETIGSTATAISTNPHSQLAIANSDKV